MHFGLNILAQFVPDWNWVFWALDQLQPGLVVVMDDHARARQIKARYPKATVVYRHYNPQDAEWHWKVTPEQWVNMHAAFAVDGIVVQCLNEPNTYVDPQANFRLCDWCSETADLAAVRGMRLALPNLGTGHTPEDQLAAGVFDKLLRSLSKHRFTHYLAVHEYWRESPTGEPWLVGRYEGLLKRCDQLGIPRPKVLVTEHGRDLGGGRRDGWKGKGYSESQFGGLLVAAAPIYRKHNAPVAIFCVGDGGGNLWESFNVFGAGGLIAPLAAYNRTVVSAAPAWGMHAWGARIDNAVARVKATINLREFPALSSADLGDLADRTPVSYYPNPYLNPNDGYLWYRVFAGGKERFAARVQDLKFEAGSDAGVDGYLARVPQTYVNLRETPNGKDIGDLYPGALARYYPERTVTAGGYTWMYVEPVGTPVGWVAQLNGLEFKPGTPPRAARLRLRHPTEHPTVTQRFGVNPALYQPFNLPAHEGIDFKAPRGSKIFACADGTVTRVERSESAGGAYGIHVRIAHQQGDERFETIYAHGLEIPPALRVGDVVKRGDVIMVADNTGNSHGDHLHLTLKKRGATARGEKQVIAGGFEVVYPNDIVDPTPYLDPFGTP